ncbi:carbohydrate ABC transporter permease [Paractinoplanes brasiliensis]|uniref:Cellobiose transport system permease protein n=1 Tax=Paractinoplanes brasiliensis TaxID=52695 RepID=A0A4R6JXH2_9ACTN|nr:sugar ABC transporter permease [Actinoplanes brasiliensis]TDO40582.1 cellobiose transport system permease protein [Actinoplanes brasiliensis]GID25652.1 ABC transporter permease [Actinoplanes brasiliensis]
MSLTELRPASHRPAPPPKNVRTRSWLHRFDNKTAPYIFISPFFILFGIFGVFPLIFNGVVAVRNWRLDDPTLTGWAGLDNFNRLLSDEDFWNALGNTFGIFILSTVPQLLIALVIANLLNRKLRGNTFWRIGILLPYLTPVVASTLVFAIFFARDNGMANWFLSLVGFGQETPLDWRAQKWSAWIAIATMVNWKWIGYNALLYLSAMQAIPRDVYEAAAVDGAGPWRQLWRITVPMIQPVVVFTVILSTIGGLQLFNEPMMFDENPQSASGGSAHQFQTIAQLIYKVGWKDLDLGYAAAMSWALFLIILIVAGINTLLTRRIGGDR